MTEVGEVAAAAAWLVCFVLVSVLDALEVSLVVWLSLWPAAESGVVYRKVNIARIQHKLERNFLPDNMPNNIRVPLSA